jgi:hypothetical protein
MKAAYTLLKNGISVLIKPLEKLFNFIFENGKFTNIWNESLLVPICTRKGTQLTRTITDVFQSAQI